MKTNLQVGGLALAAVLAAFSVPAVAQDRGDWHDRDQGGEHRGPDRAPPPAAPQRAPNAPQVQQQAHAQGQNAPQAQQRQGWQGRYPQAGNGQPYQGQGYRGQGYQGQRAAQYNQEQYNQAQADQARRDQAQREQQYRAQQQYRDGRDHGGSYDPAHRDDRYANGYDHGGYDHGGYDHRGYDHDHDWSRNWRADQRYNWNGYRYHNRGAFHLGGYYTPYRGWSYRRISIGFTLEPLFFGSSYWIGDPFAYRLPPAYGPYRWVRYYDDALLVNIYTGEVVDTVYDIFW